MYSMLTPAPSHVSIAKLFYINYMKINIKRVLILKYIIKSLKIKGGYQIYLKGVVCENGWLCHFYTDEWRAVMVLCRFMRLVWKLGTSISLWSQLLIWQETTVSQICSSLQAYYIFISKLFVRIRFVHVIEFLTISCQGRTFSCLQTGLVEEDILHRWQSVLNSLVFSVILWHPGLFGCSLVWHWLRYVK